MNGKLILCVAMVGLFAMGGCGKKEAKTPRELMSNVQDSIVQKDKDLFLSCLTPTRNK